MDKQKVNELLKEFGLLGSAQFLEMALKFDDEKLVRYFCDYWKNKRGVGGGDLVSYFTQHYRK